MVRDEFITSLAIDGFHGVDIRQPVVFRAMRYHSQAKESNLDHLAWGPVLPSVDDHNLPLVRLV